MHKYISKSMMDTNEKCESFAYYNHYPIFDYNKSSFVTHIVVLKWVIFVWIVFW